MEHVRGKVLEGDKVLHEDLDIALNLVQEEKGPKRYWGCFQVPEEPTEMKTKGPFKLKLEDGRVGSFSNPRIQSRPAGVKVAFTLDGNLQKGEDAG